MSKTSMQATMWQKIRSLPFDLHGLEIFLSVCDTGGMAAAAQELGLTQPAVSFAIADLERQTGATLFDRKVRPIALTLTGSLMRQRAISLLADARQIPPMLQQVKLGKVALIRVGLVDSLSRGATVPLSHYLAEHAQEVSILSGLTAAHAGELLTRRLDLFLGVDDLEETSGLERWEILREPYVLLLARGERRPRTVEDFILLAKTRPFIRFSARSKTGMEIERHLRRLGVEAGQTFEYDSPYAVAAMVASGRGFAISTPLCVSEAMITNKGLVTWPLPGPIVMRKLSMVARFRELGNIPRDISEIARNAFAPDRLRCG